LGLLVGVAQRLGGLRLDSDKSARSATFDVVGIVTTTSCWPAATTFARKRSEVQSPTRRNGGCSI
jgi:hypothetical protein